MNALLSPLPSVETIIETIEEEGFCLLPELLDRQTVEVARAALAEILHREQSGEEAVAASKRGWAIAVKHPIFRQIPQHPLVIEVYQRMLGPDMLISTWSSNTVLPGQGKMHWHSDHPYSGMAQPWPRDLLAGQSLWMLDDFTEQNGATALFPRSHKRNHKPDIASGEPHPDQILAEAPAGSVVLFDGRLWHSSRANRTDQSRSCLLGMYARTCIVPQEKLSAQLELFENPTEQEQRLFGGKQRQPGNFLKEKANY